MSKVNTLSQVGALLQGDTVVQVRPSPRVFHPSPPTLGFHDLLTDFVPCSNYILRPLAIISTPGLGSGPALLCCSLWLSWLPSARTMEAQLIPSAEPSWLHVTLLLVWSLHMWCPFVLEAHVQGCLAWSLASAEFTP